MTYKPRRTEGYEYVWEVMADVEEHQCSTCIFRKEGEYPMCHQVEAQLMLERPVEALDERVDGVVVCTAYKEGDPTVVDPAQPPLFNEGEL